VECRAGTNHHCQSAVFYGLPTYFQAREDLGWTKYFHRPCVYNRLQRLKRLSPFASRKHPRKCACYTNQNCNVLLVLIRAAISCNGSLGQSSALGYNDLEFFANWPVGLSPSEGTNLDEYGETTSCGHRVDRGGIVPFFHPGGIGS